MQTLLSNESIQALLLQRSRLHLIEESLKITCKQVDILCFPHTLKERLEEFCTY
jgi:hypothetical protein